MTNLAIKGIIGIQAMAEISKAAGNSEDYESFAVRLGRYLNLLPLMAFL